MRHRVQIFVDFWWLEVQVDSEIRDLIERQLLPRRERWIEGSGQTEALPSTKWFISCSTSTTPHPHWAVCLPHTLTYTWTSKGQHTASAFWQTKSVLSRWRPSANEAPVSSLVQVPFMNCVRSKNLCPLTEKCNTLNFFFTVKVFLYF